MANDPVNATIDFPPVTETPSTQSTFTVVPELPVEDFPNPIVNDGSSASAYFSAGIVSHYDTKMGLGFSPVAAADRGELAIWRVHREYTVKVVQWALQRFTLLPVCPSPDTGSTNEVLLRKISSANMPEMLPGGDILNTICGIYYYLCRKPPAPDDPLLVPNAVLLPPADTVINPVEFTSRLIGPVPDVTDHPSGTIDF